MRGRRLHILPGRVFCTQQGQQGRNDDRWRHGLVLVDSATMAVDYRIAFGGDSLTLRAFWLRKRVDSGHLLIICLIMNPVPGKVLWPGNTPLSGSKYPYDVLVESRRVLRP